MDKTFLALLKNVGLSENESEVYLALLSMGEASVLEISEKINKNRTHTHDLLHALIDRGLASYVIAHNKKQFRASNPEKLIDYLREKEEKIERQKKEIEKELPALMNLQNSTKKKTNVEIYCGKEGIKSVYNEILRTAKRYFILGATGKIVESLEFYFPHHEKERVKKKIALDILFNSELRNKDISKLRAFCSVKFLPESYSSPVPALVFGEKVAILIWDEPSAIVIENKKIAETYEKYFELLWKIAKK